MVKCQERGSSHCTLSPHMPALSPRAIGRAPARAGSLMPMARCQKEGPPLGQLSCTHAHWLPRGPITARAPLTPATVLHLCPFSPRQTCVLQGDLGSCHLGVGSHGEMRLKPQLSSRYSTTKGKKAPNLLTAV